MRVLGYTPGEVRKAVACAVGFAVTVASVALEGELIPEAAVPYVVAGIGIATSYGIFRVRNDAPPTDYTPRHRAAD